MRQIDRRLKAELLEHIDAAVLQTTENGSRTLVRSYLTLMAGLLADAADPYEEAGDVEHALRTFGHHRPAESRADWHPGTQHQIIDRCYDGGDDVGGARFHTMACRLSDAQCRHAEEFGELSPFHPDSPDYDKPDAPFTPTGGM